MKKDYKPIYEVYIATFEKINGEPVCYNEFADNEIENFKEEYKTQVKDWVKNGFTKFPNFEDYAIDTYKVTLEEFLTKGEEQGFEFEDLIEYSQDHFQNILSITTNLDRFMCWRYNTSIKCECGKHIRNQYRFTDWDNEDKDFYGLVFQDCKRVFDKAVAEDEECRCSIYLVTTCDCGQNHYDEGVLFNTKCEEYKH